MNITSTLTSRYQTTIPEAVRKQLGLQKQDQLVYELQPDGQVYIRKAEAEHSDPALRPFLQLLERDIATRPEELRELTDVELSELSNLTEGVDIDLFAPLDPEEEQSETL